jgi:hypothetical protein
MSQLIAVPHKELRAALATAPHGIFDQHKTEKPGQRPGFPIKPERLD